MTPATGERLVRFVGDQLSFQIAPSSGGPLPAGWTARLRTNLGRGDLLRQEIINTFAHKQKLANASWRDIPMQPAGDSWSLSLSLTEPGFFSAKAYLIDPDGRQHWPQGPDFGVSVHPDAYRTANTIYCAFPRMLGATRSAISTADPLLEAQMAPLDKQGFTVIPPSGKLRDLIRELPHIIDKLGCRIVHLLPVNPTPTTFARFGRFGSPYACQDLLAIDPALVEFDKRTTGVEQFGELTYAIHARGGKVFLDIVINHTGWGATLQENHPEWYVRDASGKFVSPGAWGVVWEDLVELTQGNVHLWKHLGDVFLEWCRRGVDGFRCDAGYKIPVPAWRYITARVLQEFPDTIFLLEGLGGSWEATENLLTEGGMQWAYSELFQNYSREQIADYLDYALQQSRRVGLYVHYSETHDNDRLAKKGREWSLLRNRLCALTSVSGGFGFTCGVEWLATEKIRVHGSTGLSWNGRETIVPELAQINQLLSDHPCFFDNATLIRRSSNQDDVFALSRVSASGTDKVLVLVNTNAEVAQTLTIDSTIYNELDAPTIDLLGRNPPQINKTADGRTRFAVKAGACHCLAATPVSLEITGDRYRELRAQSAWAITMISRRVRVRDLSPFDWRRMAELVQRSPRQFLAAVSVLNPARAKVDVLAALEEALARSPFPAVVQVDRHSLRRVIVVPRDHWLLIEEIAAFRAALHCEGRVSCHIQSVRVGDRHIGCFTPDQPLGDAEISGERYTTEDRRVGVRVRFVEACTQAPLSVPAPDSMILLTNGRGGMARMAVNPGAVFSKYDCVLGANLHPDFPVDRHVFVKRVRVWLNADNFVTPLNADNLIEFTPGPPARWRFVASAGDERAVEVELTADMLEGRNSTLLKFRRPSTYPPFGRELSSGCTVFLIVRVDIEDRNFHNETHRNGGADYHFNTHTRVLANKSGFAFTPATDRHLRVFGDKGVFHPEVEWGEHIPHPIEGTRGQVSEGDAFSPGWFELPLAKGTETALVATADDTDPDTDEVTTFSERRRTTVARAGATAGVAADDAFGRRLAESIQAFVVRRGDGKTVIAGYPWFLDWGRDSLICGRGLLAAGMQEEVKQLLEVFGRFEQNGTLPNIIHGADASNRDTSDAPLWYGVVCEDYASLRGGDSGRALYSSVVDSGGRTILDVLRSIAANYRSGTPNGIRMDPESALIWSPSHFTWMDTNFPAGTPREGYPVEIQVLWIRLLRQLARVDDANNAHEWEGLATRAIDSFQKLFWIEERGYLVDVLMAKAGQSAQSSVPDRALRSNGLFAVSLGLLDGKRAQRCVEAALRYLVVPGALRSLAPLPGSPPFAIHGNSGQLLNDPAYPYWGRYEGDEDTRRKPAYHNGTAWTWTFPTFCEALASAWGFDPAAVVAARNYLASMERLMDEGCVGQIPEIVDGDAPHTQRGCDAQAWSVTEAFRVWKRLGERAPAGVGSAGV
jgi:predicted glycogen debranching enzyme